MYKDKFVLSIIHDGHPVKETGYKESSYWKGSILVALPFNSEYKIRLKNKNDRSCSARVFIDDKRVSKLGDLIINANGTVNLERFIDSSLDHGKRFKFVPLDHPDIDDPTSGHNGIIKVEFRLAKKENGIKIKTDPIVWKPWDWTDYKPIDGAGDPVVYYGDNIGQSSMGFIGESVQTAYCSTDFAGARNNILRSPDPDSVEDGATVEGKHSDQSFVYSSLDVVDFPTTTLQLKIVGIKNIKQADKLVYKYCSSCGIKIRRSDKYCSECGNRL